MATTWNDADDASSPSPPRTPAAAKMREWRRRKRERGVLVTVEVTWAQRYALRRLGLLPDDGYHRPDHAALKAAVERFLEAAEPTSRVAEHAAELAAALRPKPKRRGRDAIYRRVT